MMFEKPKVPNNFGGKDFILFYFSWPCHTACGSLSSDQKWNPCPLHWKHGVLTTGLLGKSWGKSFNRQNLGGGRELQGM